MKENIVKIIWPNGAISYEENKISWFEAAKKAGVKIPSGCLRGTCGACEIEVNGKILRSCTSDIKYQNKETLDVVFGTDIYW